MKKLFLLAVTAFVCNFCFGQTIIRDANNRVLGYVEDDAFFDLASKKILDFSTDGQIKNIGGDVAATYNRESGQILDLNGDLLYSIDGNNIKGPNNSVIASVNENGSIIDGSNFLLGSAAGIDKYYMVYYFFVYNRN